MYVEVKTTAAKKKDAEKIAAALLNARAAACVQLFQIRSAYWWKGRKIKESEWLVLIKTKKSLYKKVEEIIISAHTYENPEIIATPIVRVSTKYARWLESELK